jgi:predicted Fe-Mo cluster-binding NifX family protein
MKIAISSTGKGLDSQVDPRFGRASYFIVVDSDTGEISEIIDNRPAQEAAHGAGINAASRVAGAGVQVVLTGRVGPKAYSVLAAGGVKIVSGNGGTVSEALQNFLSGKTQPSSGPDCNAHSGDPMFGPGMGRGMGRGMGGGRGGFGRGRGGL